MDEKSSYSLRRNLTGDDLAEVHDELERLDHDVADEKSAKRLPGRVPRHPVDHTESDEGGADVARDDGGLRRHGEAGGGDRRAREDEEGEAEDDCGNAADPEGDTRTDGGEAVHGREITRTSRSVRVAHDRETSSAWPRARLERCATGLHSPARGHEGGSGCHQPYCQHDGAAGVGALREPEPRR